jgi:hypothetical protein
VDIVSEELRAHKRIPGEPSLHCSGFMSAFSSKREEDESLKTYLKAKRSHWLPFHGLLASHVRCGGCGVARVVCSQPFCSLSLTIGHGQVGNRALAKMATATAPARSATVWTVHDSLRRFVEEESLSEVECGCCSADHLTEGLRGKIRELGREGKDNGAAVASELGRIASQVKFWRGSGVCSSGEFESWDALISSEIVSKYEEAEEGSSHSTAADTSEAVVEAIDALAGSVRQTTSKRLLLSQAPRCLCLHISRKVVDMFTGQLTKVETFVRFPVLLDISPYRCSSSGTHLPGNANPNLYRLKAVVVHLGSADRGHYITYAAVKLPLEASADGAVSATRQMQWVMFSDANTQPVSEAEVLASRAFLLFYEQNMP